MDQSRWSIDLGNVYFSKENYTAAEKWFSKAHSLALSIHDQKGIVASLNELVRIQLERDDLQKAEEYNQEALAAAARIPDPFQQSRSLLYAAELHQAEIAMRRAQFSEAAKLLQDLVAHSNDSSLMFRVHSDLAKIDVVAGRLAEADREFNAGVHAIETARSAVKQEERRMSILDAWPFYDEYVYFLVHSGQIRKALQIAEFNRARTLAEGLNIVGPQAADISIERIKHSLQGTNRVVLAYWLAKDESYLWAITSSQFQHYPLPPKREIQAQIQAYSDKLRLHKGIDDSAVRQPATHRV